MSDDEIMVAIAEKCGWIRHNCQQGRCTNINHAVWSKGEQRGSILDLPDYPHDLNACHEFEKTLTVQQKRDYYTFLWKSIVADMPHIRTDAHLWANISATARQRCEAFLRVHGLWKDNPTPERSESK